MISNDTLTWEISITKMEGKIVTLHKDYVSLFFLILIIFTHTCAKKDNRSTPNFKISCLLVIGFK